ncbi:ATP-binding protein [Saccharomonospora piscinae]|uniref:ATP-binding protein n=1 Tax=Saccharomonospora piscinae TaxID=687388 RepID=UPI0004671141|nr:ATP-binding protein [Saccharomonospora piscinae]
MSGAALAVTGSVHVSQARQLAARAAREAGMPAARVERVALATSELATNLVKYATGGLLLVVPHEGVLDVIATDRGPGMAHVTDSMRDGFSTTGTLGIGLGGIRRNADEFDIYSRYGEGTTVLARWYGEGSDREPRIPGVAAARYAAPGETECGDSWVVARAGGVTTVALSDGLGHGPGAAAASAAATEHVRASPASSLTALVAAMDADMTAHRGATVALAQFREHDPTVLFCGVGNSTVRLIAGDGGHETLVSTPGIVGRRQRSGRRASPVARPWDARSWLIMHSDGISQRWNAAEHLDAFEHDPATVAGWLLGAHGRHRDDACAVVVSGGERM